ncbi:MAG: hypothetical protein HDQ44_02960 [Desulfovibrio sp.]|nr:hypothetical protein [Desulfovibrio sp.]
MTDTGDQTSRAEPASGAETNGVSHAGSPDKSHDDSHDSSQNIGPDDNHATNGEISHAVSPEAGGDAGKVSLAKQDAAGGEPAAQKDDAPDAGQAAGAPAETAAQALQEHGRLNACFNAFSRIGPLFLLLVLCCMAWPIFWLPANGVYCPAEVRHLTAFLHCLADGSWLAPTGLAGNEFTAAQWPAFSWVIGLLALSPTLVESGYLLPATTFLCAFFAALGVWCLSHAAGFGFRAAFAAGLILLCSPLFAPLPHFLGPAALCAGFFLFALVFFCRGWRGNESWLSLPLAFICTALATLAGGFLPLVVLLVGSLCYLIWRGELRRAHRADAIFGFILMLVIFGCWLALLMLRHINDAYLGLLFANAWQWTLPIPLKWFLPLAAGLLGCLPWILMIFGVSWQRVLATAGKSLASSRHENASALIWISLALALCVAIFVPQFHPAAVIIACLVCVLLGKAAINLGPVGGRFFCYLAAIATIIAGAVILCLSFSGTRELVLNQLPALPVPDPVQMLEALAWLPAVGAILLAAGLIALIFARHFSGCGLLVYAILVVVILCQPCRLGLAPDLARMPDTPLLSFAAVEARVADALAAPVQVQPAPETLPTPVIPVPPAPEALTPQDENTVQPEPDAPAPQTNIPPAPAAPEEVIIEATPVPETQPETAPPQQEQAQ